MSFALSILKVLTSLLVSTFAKNVEGDDSVFVDLGLSFQEYPKVPTTW